MSNLEIHVIGLSTEMVVDLLRGKPLFLGEGDDEHKTIIVCDMPHEKIVESLEEAYGAEAKVRFGSLPARKLDG